MTDASTPAAGRPPLLEGRNLVKHFPLKGAGLFGRNRGTVHALNGVSLKVNRQETLAVVGESGCGKTTLAKTLSLLQHPTQGWLWFDGQSLSNSSSKALKDVKRQIQLIFQDPYSSLNPRLSASNIIAEPLIIHGNSDRRTRQEQVVAAAAAVGINADNLDQYPHQFSGGQRQRIAIARALVAEPELVIADEPLSALDISTQSQILNLLMELRKKTSLAFLLISHDLSVVRHVADRVAVMYLGRIIETASIESLFAMPQHPYTQALITAIPEPGRGKRRSRKVLEGDVPSPLRLPEGCPFAGRCPKAREICRFERPRLALMAPPITGHSAACHFPGG